MTISTSLDCAVKWIKGKEMNGNVKKSSIHSTEQ